MHNLKENIKVKKTKDNKLLEGHVSSEYSVKVGKRASCYPQRYFKKTLT